MEPSLSLANQRQASPVTIWRTYMIANEWNELQNYRKTSLGLQLALMLFLLEVLNLKAWALAMPGLEIRSCCSALTNVCKKILQHHMTRH